MSLAQRTRDSQTNQRSSKTTAKCVWTVEYKSVYCLLCSVLWWSFAAANWCHDSMSSAEIIKSHNSVGFLSFTISCASVLFNRKRQFSCFEVSFYFICFPYLFHASIVLQRRQCFRIYSIAMMSTCFFPVLNLPLAATFAHNLNHFQRKNHLTIQRWEEAITFLGVIIEIFQWLHSLEFVKWKLSWQNERLYSNHSSIPVLRPASVTTVVAHTWKWNCKRVFKRMCANVIWRHGKLWNPNNGIEK